MNTAQKIEYLNALPLAEANWWFVVNSERGDPDRLELFEALKARQAEPEPARLIFDATQQDNLVNLAANACTVMRDMYMGWPWKESLGDETLPALRHFLRTKCKIDDEGGWDCDLTEADKRDPSVCEGSDK